MKTLMVAVGISSTLVAAEPVTPGAEEIARAYKTLSLLTPKAVWNQSPIYPCARPATPEQLAAIKEREKGLHSSWYVKHYRNTIALDSTDKTFPVGSVLIKEKLKLDYQTPILPLLKLSVFRLEGRISKDKGVMYDPMLRASALAGMIKRAPGSLPKSADWEFFWFEDGKLTTTGLESCAGCHSGAKHDYVFTAFRTAMPGAGK